MPATLQSLGIDQLSRDDRLALVQALWDSIAAEGRTVLTKAQCEELERRADEDDADPDGGIPWEDVKARSRR